MWHRKINQNVIGLLAVIFTLSCGASGPESEIAETRESQESWFNGMSEAFYGDWTDRMNAGQPKAKWEPVRFSHRTGKADMYKLTYNVSSMGFVEIYLGLDENRNFGVFQKHGSRFLKQRTWIDSAQPRTGWRNYTIQYQDNANYRHRITFAGYKTTDHINSLLTIYHYKSRGTVTGDGLLTFYSSHYVGSGEYRSRVYALSSRN